LAVPCGHVDAHPDSTNLANTAGGDIVLDSDISPTFNVAYMLTDYISTELFAAWPFTNGIDLKTEGGDKTRIGNVDILPPALTLNWHFNPDGTFRPYIGAGVAYTLFSGEELRGPLANNGLEIEDAVGATGQVGIDIGTSEKVFVNLNARYLDLGADAEVNGSDVGTLDLNPWIYSVNLGFRFGKPAPVAAPEPAPLRSRPRRLRPLSRSAAMPTTMASAMRPTSARAPRLA
jgi:outer membrane protein